MDFWIKAGGAVFGLLLVSGSYWLTYSRGFDAGQINVKQSVSSAAVLSASATLKEIEHANTILQNNEDQIINSPLSDDGPLAPVLSRALNQLRKPSN